MSRWFRLYDDLVDDPKIQRLPGETVKALLNLWCLASQNEGMLPAADDIAFKLRIKPAKVQHLLSVLGECGLIDSDETGLRPHNWNERQFKSDEKKGAGKDSYVYFIGKSWGSTLKVGFSKNPWARIAELQTAQPDKLVVLATFRCKSHSEVDLHDVLRDFRKSGEWFDLPTKIYVAVHDAADRSLSYDDLVGKLRSLLRSTTTETEQRQTTEQISDADASGAEAPIDHRKRLFDEGLKKLASMTGKGPDACRSFVGKCLKAASDDAIVVLGLIEDAERNQTVDPAAWISARLKSRENSTNGKRTVHDAIRDLRANVQALNEPAPGLCDGTGGNPLRLLPPRGRERS